MVLIRSIIFLWIFCFLLGCSQKNNSSSENTASVKVYEVSSLETASTRNYVGIAEESIMTDLSFEVDGNITAMKFREGELVEKGELIATLINPVYKDSYNAALASYRRSEDAYNRLKSVYESGSLPEIEWIEAETNKTQAQAMANVAEKKMKDCFLYAPYAGVISKKYLEIGTNVAPGVPVYRLASVTDVNIKVSIPEKEISNIQVGQEALVNVRALNDKEFQGKVVEKGVIANPLSHTYEIRILLENISMSLLPGMVCSVSLSNPDNNEEIVIPSNAIRIGGEDHHYVWLVKDGIAVRRDIVPESLAKNGMSVSGLQIGDLLIIEGYQNVSEGMKVVYK